MCVSDAPIELVPKSNPTRAVSRFHNGARSGFASALIGARHCAFPLQVVVRASARSRAIGEKRVRPVAKLPESALPGLALGPMMTPNGCP